MPTRNFSPCLRSSFTRRTTGFQSESTAATLEMRSSHWNIPLLVLGFPWISPSVCRPRQGCRPRKRPQDGFLLLRRRYTLATFGPNSPKMTPRWLKMASRGPQEAPRGLQDGRKMALRWSQSVQGHGLEKRAVEQMGIGVLVSLWGPAVTPAVRA